MADQFIGGFLSPTRFPDNMNLFVKLWAFLSELKVRKITPQSYGNWLFTNHFQWRSIRLRSVNWNFLSVEQTAGFSIVWKQWSTVNWSLGFAFWYFNLKVSNDSQYLSNNFSFLEIELFEISTPLIMRCLRAEKWSCIGILITLLGQIHQFPVLGLFMKCRIMLTERLHCESILWSFCHFNCRFLLWQNSVTLLTIYIYL